MRKAALHNLGCKVNAYETEAMQEMLEQNGYEIVPFAEGADVYVINTCTVTNMADRKSRQMLHRARKMNPNAVVVAAGCYVQAQGAKADDCIDIIIGNNKKKDLIAILDVQTGRAYQSQCKGSGRMQSVLFILYYPVCQRTGAQQKDGRCARGGTNTGSQWLSGDCADRNPSQLLRH